MARAASPQCAHSSSIAIARDFLLVLVPQPCRASCSTCEVEVEQLLRTEVRNAGYQFENAEGQKAGLLRATRF